MYQRNPHKNDKKIIFEIINYSNCTVHETGHTSLSSTLSCNILSAGIHIWTQQTMKLFSFRTTQLQPSVYEIIHYKLKKYMDKL